jgi:hypothetical protein
LNLEGGVVEEEPAAEGFGVKKEVIERAFFTVFSVLVGALRLREAIMS